jgi:hypothetical protein
MRAHGLDLGLGGAALQVGHAARTQRGVAQQRRGIQRSRRVAQRLQIRAEAAEAMLRPLHRQRDRRRRERVRFQRRGADAAVAGDHGGHALRDLEVHVGLCKQCHVVMCVCVDEAGRDDQPTGVHALPCGPALQVSQGDDAAIANAHVGVEARCARAVDDGAAFDQQVERFGHASSFVGTRWRALQRTRLRRRPSRCRCGAPPSRSSGGSCRVPRQRHSRPAAQACHPDGSGRRHSLPGVEARQVVWEVHCTRQRRAGPSLPAWSRRGRTQPHSDSAGLRNVSTTGSVPRLLRPCGPCLPSLGATVTPLGLTA